MSSLESGVEKIINKGRGKSAEENLAGFEVAFKLQKAIKEAKANKDPNYAGDNPKTAEDVIKDLSAMGKVSKSKRSEAHKVESVKKVGDSKKEKTKLKLEEKQGAKQAQAVEEKGSQATEVVIEQQNEIQATEGSATTAKTKERVETSKKTAIDEQIALMRGRLRKLESSSKIFDKKADSEQKTEREKLIKELEIGIAKAEKKKKELETAEKENKGVKQTLVKKDKHSEKVNPLKRALENQINKIQKPNSTSEESTDKYAETLVKSVFGDDVFERDDKKLEEVIVMGEADHPEVVEQKEKSAESEEQEKQGPRKRKAKTSKKEPKKNGGPAPASGLTPDEEAGERLRAQRRAARAKEAESKKQEPVVLSKPPEVSPVIEPRVEMPPVTEPQAEISGQAEARQEEEAKREKLFDKIHRLNEEVTEARAKYVQEDYENTKIWKKLFSMFRIKEDVEKGEWRAEYEAKTLELQKAELEMVETGEKDRQRDTRKEMSGLIRYYKLDERMDLINERTQYRAKNMTFGEKIGDTFGSLGRWYNSIPFKQKMIIAGALGGAALAAPVVGGALGATVYATMMARRWVAGAGLAVGVEASLEKLGEKRRAKQTGEEIEQQMSGLEGTTEQAFSNLEKMLEQDVLSLDSKLQHEKRSKTYRKLAATTLGVVVGSGWLSQIIMDKLGGKEALEWVKESLGFGEVVSEDLSLPKSPVTDEMVADTTAKATTEVRDNFINQFVNQDIVVEKGDSVWKISGRLADQLNLDGTQRTYFIDAMKDKFGDVHLQTGEHINFSEHGINEDFVNHTLEDSNAISPEQSAQILENNTRLSAFAEANPDVRLTDEVTKNILEGKTPGVAGQMANEFRFGPQADIEYQPTPTSISPEDIVLEYGARADGWYDQIFKVENVQFNQVILSKDVIESLKIRDVFHDAQLFQQGASEGYTTGLSKQEIANFAKFDTNASNGKSILFDRMGFLRNNPNATVLDYLKKIASLTKRGQHIGPYASL